MSDRALSNLTAVTDPTAGDLGYVVSGGNSRKIDLGTLLLKVPLSSTDNVVPRFDGTTGKLQSSGMTISDAGAIGLPSGAFFSWNGGDVTISHSPNTLAFAGASSGYFFDAAIIGGFQTSSTLTLKSTSSLSAATDAIYIRAGQSMATPALVLTPVSGRLPSVVQIDTYGNVFITATDGSNESSIGGDYDLEHPFFRVGQPASVGDPDKPPGNVFNINANITTTKSAFNVFDVNVYSNASSSHGHYAGQFTAYSGASSSGVGAIGVNVYNDNAATGSHGIVVGLASSVAISGGDLGGVQVIIGQHGATPRAVDYGYRVASRGTGMSVDMAFQLDNTAVISAAGTILGLRSATKVACAWGIDFNPNSGTTDATFSGGAIRSKGFTVDGAGITTMPYLILTDGVSAPSTVAGKAIIYVDTADGDLKCKFGDGFVRVIGADS